MPDTLRSYLSKLRPVRLSEVGAEERAAAALVADTDLRMEVDWLLGLVTAAGSPVVFSHNDVNTGNILVREDGSNADPITLIGTNQISNSKSTRNTLFHQGLSLHSPNIVIFNFVLRLRVLCIQLPRL